MLSVGTLICLALIGPTFPPSIELIPTTGRELRLTCASARSGVGLRGRFSVGSRDTQFLYIPELWEQDFPALSDLPGLWKVR